MERALAAHQSPPKPVPRSEFAIRAENYPAARRHRGCIHCHNVNEFQRADSQARGVWNREDLWVYPLPENIGLTLDNDVGDRVKTVIAGSAAEKAGLKANDRIKLLNGRTVASFGDATYALHKAPAKGTIEISWLRGQSESSAKLDLAEGWRKTNITWRPSMLDIMPSVPFSGDDLSVDEKKKLGLDAKRAAFRMDKFVHTTLKAVGIQQGDVIIGFNGQSTEGEMTDLLGIVRRNYLVGETVTVNMLRDGKSMNVMLKLK